MALGQVLGAPAQQTALLEAMRVQARSAARSAEIELQAAEAPGPGNVRARARRRGPDSVQKCLKHSKGLPRARHECLA